MQWSDEANAGFTTGKPWFYVNQNYKEINVAAEERDPDSLLNFYRRAVAMRKSLPVVRYGTYRERLRASGKLYVYEREYEGARLLVVCSFSDRPVMLPRRITRGAGELILCNYPGGDSPTLRPYEARVYSAGK